MTAGKTQAHLQPSSGTALPANGETDPSTSRRFFQVERWDPTGDLDRTARYPLMVSLGSSGTLFLYGCVATERLAVILRLVLYVGLASTTWWTFSAWHAMVLRRTAIVRHAAFGWLSLAVRHARGCWVNIVDGDSRRYRGVAAGARLAETVWLTVTHRHAGLRVLFWPHDSLRSYGVLTQYGSQSGRGVLEDLGSLKFVGLLLCSGSLFFAG
jgi:hypothetical protein